MVIRIDDGLKRRVWSFLKDNNVGNRSRANGNKTEQDVGLLGVSVVKNHFGINSNLNNGFDGGFDFEYNGIKVDVKTMGRTVDPKPYYVNNFISYQSDFDCDAYIFCSINKKTSDLTICGWVTKDELMDRSLLYKEGSIRTRTDGTTFKMKAPTYEIKNADLNSIETL